MCLNPSPNVKHVMTSIHKNKKRRFALWVVGEDAGYTGANHFLSDGSQTPWRRIMLVLRHVLVLPSYWPKVWFSQFLRNIRAPQKNTDGWFPKSHFTSCTGENAKTTSENMNFLASWISGICFFNVFDFNLWSGLLAEHRSCSPSEPQKWQDVGVLASLCMWTCWPSIC